MKDPLKAMKEGGVAMRALVDVFFGWTFTYVRFTDTLEIIHRASLQTTQKVGCVISDLDIHSDRICKGI